MRHQADLIEPRMKNDYMLLQNHMFPKVVEACRLLSRSFTSYVEGRPAAARAAAAHASETVTLWSDTGS